MLGKDKILAIGSDHAGFLLKEYLKEKLVNEGFELIDYGTYSTQSVDYPDYAIPLCQNLILGKFDRGILICGTGNGMAMTANKFKGIRAALCWSEEIGKFARSHNDANVLVFPARFIEPEAAWQVMKIFLETGFEGGRHLARVLKIDSAC